jgi:hypothetical protein
MRKRKEYAKIFGRFQPKLRISSFERGMLPRRGRGRQRWLLRRLLRSYKDQQDDYTDRGRRLGKYKNNLLR